MTVRLHLITRYTYIFSYQCYRSIPLSHNEETTIEQANEMSRFNRGARRIIDENGRFTRVSMDDYATLRSKAESVARSELGSPSRSPGTGSETGTEPFGWRPGTTDEGSVVDGSEAEEDPTSKAPDALVVGAGGKETLTGCEREVRVIFGHDGEDFTIPIRSIPLLVGERHKAMGADLLIGVVALEMMGFNVGKYYSVEQDPLARKVADLNCGGKQNRTVLGHDAMMIEEEQLCQLEDVDVLMVTPDCGDWSALLDRPDGFEGKGGEFFLKCGMIKRTLEEEFPDMVAWGETNCVSGKMTEQERLGLIGRSVSFHHYRVLFANIVAKPKTRVKSVVMRMEGVDFMDVNSCDPDSSAARRAARAARC